MRTQYTNGQMLIECRADQFGQSMKMAAKTDRCVLPDGRPAIRRLNELGGYQYITMHPYAWDILKKLKKDRTISPRTKVCEFCFSEMKVAREFERCWTFACPVCKSTEIHDKQFIGGTRGAGEKEKH